MMLEPVSAPPRVCAAAGASTVSFSLRAAAVQALFASSAASLDGLHRQRARLVWMHAAEDAAAVRVVRQLRAQHRRRVRKRIKRSINRETA